MKPKTLTVHGVLAGAYKAERTLLYHCSEDDGETALCGRVQPGHLADIYATPAGQAPTCARCRAKASERIWK